ncbi:MAG: carbohydrate ABC transporter permease [Anaerolineales bacterium]|jgi:ABC-type glycerol-3-phosphate transport system permease component
MKRRNAINQTIYLMLLSLGGLATIFPFIYMISTSLKGPVYVFELPPRLIPSHPTLQNFVSAWTSNNFGRYFLNSLGVTVVTTLLVVWLGSMMAYAFARFEFALKRPLYYLVMFFMMMPAMSLIVPQFILAARLKQVDTLSGLVLLYVAQNIPLATFLLRGFLEQVPREIEEAALIDGASAWDVYWQVLLPLSKPALATAAIFSSLGAWDEYVWAFTILNTPEKRTLPVGIAAFHGVHLSDWGLVFAASLIAVVPVIALFVALQKYFIKGMTAGAIKG